MRKLLTGLGVVLLFGEAAPAQDVIIPADRVTEIEMGCQVQGLDPNGDGFLALRAGPGTQYAQIGSLRNGDAAYIASRSCPGNWCYVENGAIGGQESRFRGWIYNKWCQFYP